MKKTSILLLCGLVLFLQWSYGQTGNTIPPSPAMATFQRFGDYPVSYATGLPNINVPLYDIKLKDFDWPISINFHASGRRGTFDLSALGVGWVLNASGYVSRQIKERPDEDYVGMEISSANTTDLNYGGTNFAYDRVINADMTPGAQGTWVYSESGKEDSEHDIFSYGVGSLSGKFVADKNHNCLPLTFGPFAIGGGLANGSFSGTDEKGAQYYFGTSSQAIETTYISSGELGAQATPHPVGWYLNQIITPAHDVINFQYGMRLTSTPDDNVTGNYTPGDYWISGYMNPTQPNLSGGDEAPAVQDFYSNYDGAHHQEGSTGLDYTIYYLQEIDFNGGKVVFTYDNNSLYITRCQVINSNNQTIRDIGFTYLQAQSPALYNNNSLFLTGLQFRDNNGQPVETYSFDYYNGGVYTGGSNNMFAALVDWWGYYNGTGSQPPIRQDNPPIQVMVPGCTGCKEPSFNGALAGMLKSITYPTGGNTQFTYEPNLYSINGVNTLPGPGIRIQQIVSDDGSGNKLTRKFKYGTGENGIGQLLHFPDAIDFKTAQTFVILVPYYCCEYNISTYYPHPNVSMAEAYAQPIYYPAVTEYVTSPDGVNNGKTIYSFSLPSAYTWPSEPNDYLGHFTPGGFRMKEWTGGKLIDKQTYRFRPSSNDYQLVDEESNSYDQFDYVKIPQIRLFRDTYIAGYRQSNDFADEKMVADAMPNGTSIPIQNVGNGHGFVDFYDFPIESAVEKLVGTSHVTYDDQGHSSTTGVSYYYDNNYNNPANVFPIQTVMTTSTGDQVMTETQYLPASPYFPIEHRDYRSNPNGTSKRLIGSNYTSYYYNFPLQQFKTESPVPLTDFQPATSQGKDPRYALKNTNTYDEKFNVVQQLGEDGVPVSYVWSYNSEYPIAKIVNAPYTTVQSALGGNSAILAFRDSNPTDAQVNSFLAPLRTALPSAMVTTYTYIPLIGMTNSTDVNGKTTHYEYDSFGRLKDVKDFNGNVIKTFDYHYKGQ